MDERPDRSSAGERWPAVALLLLLLATGLVMGSCAVRGLNALRRCGLTSPYAITVAVAVPTIIGGAIVGFVLALWKRGGARTLAPHPGVNESGRMARLAVFIVPLVVVSQMAAALLGGVAGSHWSTFLLASLLPTVPLAVVGFGSLLLTAGAAPDRHRGRVPSRITPPAEPPRAGLD